MRLQISLHFLSLLMLSTNECRGFLRQVMTESGQRTGQLANRIRLLESKKAKYVTLGELRNEMKKRPHKFLPTEQQSKNKNGRRTRRRVETPKQKYLYKSQRERLQSEASETGDDKRHNYQPHEDVRLAIDLGMKASAQHCDPLIDAVEPSILGRIRVDEGENSGSYAYILDKPPGWAILGNRKVSNDKQQSGTHNRATTSRAYQIHDKKKFIRQVKAKNEDGSLETFEFSELDILGLLNPEEREQYLDEHQDLQELLAASGGLSGSTKQDVLSRDGSQLFELFESHTVSSDKALSVETERNLKRIASRENASSVKASFYSESARRPSLVSWLKEHKKQEDERSIRGGNFWMALAGATEVDDSGLVLLCPREAADKRKLCCEFIEYVAVVGNGGHRRYAAASNNQTFDGLLVETFSRLRTHRGDDVIQTAKVLIPGSVTSCTDVVKLCEQKFEDGVRGDTVASPLERRSWRRQIHCQKISVSSLDYDESLTIASERLPDDMTQMIDRRSNQKYKSGSWLGRSSLRANPLTTAYREINGAADGFPGWIVDRYDRWLFVQHDPDFPSGPLPSIHDGFTAGVYYLQAVQDRKTMGLNDVRPTLLEGQALPDGLLPIMENGITYLVSLSKDLSTGIFLDQRPSRAWLARHCTSDTTVLNCFAHTGAFSVAAATAGASTVSIDMSKKWLDRLPMQLEANGIAYDERHDCIYGDCFQWLRKLAKRGEKYDIVILDPPSTSVSGGKKKRWSVANDMDELAALAASLVKEGGILLTTTNSARISAAKFSRMCKRGLDEAGIEAKLDRLQPMPLDFPSIGPQPVKNLLWRITSLKQE